MRKLSIIIPTLNEAANLETTLRTLGGDHEIIVADGGSDDSTRQIAEACGATFTLCGIRSRAGQMNRGAEIATGEVFLFLHADTLVPESSIENLLCVLDLDEALVGGGCHRFFDSESIFLKLTCHLANFRSKRWGIFLGDQGLFVRKQIFEALGGFRETLSVGEDLDFSLRMKQLGFVQAITPPVLTSARRFDHIGPLRQTSRDLWEAIRIFRSNKRQS